jgi:hypothetical protein
VTGVAPIETRSGLLDALVEAAELEHSLLVQYLFAAFTIPTRGDDRRAAELAREAKRVVLAVAREEMVHLGLVSNLLAAVGGEAALRIPLAFPKPSRWFPNVDDSPETFSLEPLTARSIDRFIRFEAPDEEPGGCSSVGDLYRAIAGAIRRFDDDELFVGPPAGQEVDEWSNRFRLDAVVDTASALRCIDRIVVEGEGGPHGGASSHYARFLRVRDELLGDMLPPLAAGPNPTLRDEPGSGERTPVSHGSARGLMAVFDDAYTTTLLMLELLYRFPPALSEHRPELRDAIRRSMSGLIRPLGEVLVTLPSGVPGRNAGPAFAIDVEFRTSEDVPSALAVIEERLHETAAAARTVEARPGVGASAALLAGRVGALRGRVTR